MIWQLSYQIIFLDGNFEYRNLKTNPMITKHQLTLDFPEFEAKIHDLKVNDNHFKNLFDKYDELDHEIYRIETDSDPASDDTLNSLRIERVRIKDEIYQFLLNN